MFYLIDGRYSGNVTVGLLLSSDPLILKVIKIQNKFTMVYDIYFLTSESKTGN